MKRKFEEFLQEWCSDLHPEVLDDDGPDDFEGWLNTIDTDELIELADLYGKECELAGMDKLLNK